MRAYIYTAAVMAIMLAFLSAGCSFGKQASIRQAAERELEPLCQLETIDELEPYLSLFADASDTIDTSTLQKLIPAYFAPFQYEILNVQCNSHGNQATVKVRFTTRDAKSIATDYDRLLLRTKILKSIDPNSKSLDHETVSLSELYELLYTLLADNQYATTDSVCDLKLKKEEDGTWTVLHTKALENSLTGGLVSYLSDPELLSPEDTLSTCFDTIKEMDLKSMSDYLGFPGLTTEDSLHDELADALADQVDRFFSYEITGSEVSGNHATVSAIITSFDSEQILATFAERWAVYLDSSESVMDGEEGRDAYSQELLVSCKIGRAHV